MSDEEEQPILDKREQIWLLFKEYVPSGSKIYRQDIPRNVQTDKNKVRYYYSAPSESIKTYSNAKEQIEHEVHITIAMSLGQDQDINDLYRTVREYSWSIPTGENGVKIIRSQVDYTEDILEGGNLVKATIIFIATFEEDIPQIKDPTILSKIDSSILKK